MDVTISHAGRRPQHRRLLPLGDAADHVRPSSRIQDTQYTQENECIPATTPRGVDQNQDKQIRLNTGVKISTSTGEEDTKNGFCILLYRLP